MKKRFLTLALIVSAVLIAYNQVDRKVNRDFNENFSSHDKSTENKQEISETDVKKSKVAIADKVEADKLTTSNSSDSIKSEKVSLELEKGENTALYDYLKNKGNPNYKNSLNKSLLSIAALDGNVEAVDYLIKSDADINITDDNGSTPLMNAIMGSTASGESLEAIDSLIEAGADLNIANNEGLTPVHMAIELDNPVILKKLLQAGAIQTKLTGGQTPLMMAAIDRSNKVLSTLVEFGANPNEQADDGKNALMMAINSDNYPGGRILLGMGASELQKDKEGKSARDYASVSENELVKAFFSDER